MSLHFIQWTALHTLYCSSKENRLEEHVSIYDAYPEYNQRWFHWNDYFVPESKKNPNSAKAKLYLKNCKWSVCFLDGAYVEI